MTLTVEPCRAYDARTHKHELVAIIRCGRQVPHEAWRHIERADRRL